MWILADGGNCAVNLTKCLMLKLDRRDDAGRSWAVVAWDERRGINVFEGTRQECRDFVRTVTARMNGEVRVVT